MTKERFAKLYGLNKDKLYRYALYRLGDPDDAEDAVSECVLAAWKGIGSLRSEDAFSSWIHSILHNICAGMVRSKIRERDALSSSAQDLNTEALSPGSTSLEIYEALNKLSELEREVILLSVVSGLTSREISEITGLAPGSVRSKQSRSLAKMRTLLS